MSSDVSTTEEKLNPFHDDKLGVETFAHRFKNLLLSGAIIHRTSESYHSEVYSINASWGNGKTYFIKNLKQLVEQDNEALCFYINAWESEYFNNPFLTILHELISSFDNTPDEISELKDAGIKIQKNFSFQVSAVVVSAGCGYQEKTIDIFEDYKATKKVFESFIEQLGLIREKEKKPLIFFIDELDRCNPEYAIKTLEILKHFFNVEGIKFVLSIDRKQIENVLKIRYGIDEEENINGFLRKIIDVDFYLPEPSYEKYSKFLYDDIYKIKDFMEVVEQNGQGFCFAEWEVEKESGEDFLDDTGNKDRIHELVACLCKDFNVSLRELEKIYFNLNLILKTSKLGTHLLILDIVVFFVFIKYSNKSNYEKLKKNEYYLNNPDLTNTNLKFKDNSSLVDGLLKCYFVGSLNHREYLEHHSLYNLLVTIFSRKGIPPFREYFNMIDLTEEVLHTSEKV